MSKQKRVFLLMIILMITLAGCSKNRESNAQNPSEIAIMTVNGELVVSKEDFDSRYQQVLNATAKQRGESFLDQTFEGFPVVELIAEQVLNDLLYEHLIQSYVEASGFVLDEGLLTEKKNILLNNEEAKQYHESIGVDDQYVEDMIIHGIFLEKFHDLATESLKNEFPKYENEIKNTIVKIHSRHILVSSLEEAEAIRLRIIEEDNFEELARLYSEDPVSSESGGNLGLLTRDQMLPEYEEAVFNANTGDLLEPVKSQFGYHVIYIENQLTINDLIEQEEDEAVIAEFIELLQLERLDDYMYKLLDQLYQEAEIEIFKDQIDYGLQEKESEEVS